MIAIFVSTLLALVPVLIAFMMVMGLRGRTRLIVLGVWLALPVILTALNLLSIAHLPPGVCLTPVALLEIVLAWDFAGSLIGVGTAFACKALSRRSDRKLS